MDDRTASFVAEALRAARNGDAARACEIGDHALAQGGDPGALHAMLGMLRLRLGLGEAAVGHLEIAHAAYPSDRKIAINLANALCRTGRMERAFALSSHYRASADASLQLFRIRGFAGHEIGEFEAAAEALEQVVAKLPGDARSWNNLGNARVAAGDIAAGIAALEKAVALRPEMAARVNLALAHKRAGDLATAETMLRSLVDEFPAQLAPLLSLHDVLREQLKEAEVGEVLKRALALAPESVPLLLARARHSGTLLQMDDAEEGFRSVLRHDPRNAEAFVGLAVVYEHSRPAELDPLMREAQDREIEANALNLVQAFAHRRARRFREGIAAVRLVDPAFESARREQLLGNMLDGLGEHRAAFRAFARMNEIYCADPSQPLERARTLRARIAEEVDGTTCDWFSTWEKPAPEVDRAPCFLVGFPRSGTTLLDTILMGHPDVTVMEERPVIARLKQEIGGFAAIARLRTSEIRAAQRRYFEIAAEYVPLVSGQMLVDKSPLLLNEAATIHRLFPGAPFIFVVRHPADVLLSCFISSFNLNDAMSNFLTLESAAEFYDLTMRAWENSRALFPLKVLPLRYEEMVEDPARVLADLAAGLGLEWHDNLLDHTRTAANRGLITTASYAQVTEPIYRHSIGRWRSYRAELEPVFRALQPWTERFGYPSLVGRSDQDG